MRSLAQSLVDRGVRVNAVAPGPIWTPLIPASFGAEKRRTPVTRCRWIAQRNLEKSRRAYVYLACEESSHITGQTLHLNGGLILNA